VKVTCARNNYAKEHIMLSIKHYLNIFYILNQSIDVQQCVHVKNHHDRTNYDDLDYSLNWWIVGKKKHGIFIHESDTPILNEAFNLL
jgi:hypothetical protein